MTDDRPAPATPARLRSLPSWLAAQLAVQGDRLVSARLATLQLRKPHFTSLVALAEAGPSSQAHLGRVLMMDRSDVHAVVTALEDRGLVSRVQDEDDRRRKVVQITAEGRATLRRANRAVDAAQTDLLRDLGEAEREQLVALLTRVVAGATD